MTRRIACAISSTLGQSRFMPRKQQKATLSSLILQKVMLDSSFLFADWLRLTSHSVFMSFDGELFLTGGDRPELDQPTPSPRSQSASPRGKLTRSTWPVISNFTTLICHLQPTVQVTVLTRHAGGQSNDPAFAFAVVGLSARTAFCLPE